MKSLILFLLAIFNNSIAVDKGDLQNLLQHIRGNNNTYAITVTLSDSLYKEFPQSDHDKSFFLDPSSLQKFEEVVAESIKNFPKEALLLIVTQEGLFNRYKSYPNNENYAPFNHQDMKKFLTKIENLSKQNSNTFLIINYCYQREPKFQKDLTKIKHFNDKIKPILIPPTAQYGPTIKILQKTQSCLQTQEKVSIFINKTAMYWKGEKIFSYRKMIPADGELEGLGKDLENPKDIIFLPGTRLHYDKSIVSQILSEIFGFEICQDHFLKTFQKLGGMGTNEILRRDKGSITKDTTSLPTTRIFNKKIIIKEAGQKQPNTAIMKDNVSDLLLVEPESQISRNAQHNLTNSPLLHVIQSATIKFQKELSPFNNVSGGIVIHADSNAVYNQIYYFNGNECGKIVEENYKLHSYFYVKTFPLQQILKKIDFKATILTEYLEKEQVEKKKCTCSECCKNICKKCTIF